MALAVCASSCVLFDEQTVCAADSSCASNQVCDVSRGVCVARGPSRDGGLIVDGGVVADAGTPDADVFDGGRRFDVRRRVLP